MNIPSKMEFLRVNHLQMGRFPWLCWITRGLRSSRTLWDQNPPPFCQENHVAQLSKPIPRAKLSDAKPLLAQLGKFWSKNLSQLGLSFQYLSTKIENAPENGKHNFGSPESIFSSFSGQCLAQLPLSSMACRGWPSVVTGVSYLFGPSQKCQIRIAIKYNNFHRIAVS